MQGRYYLVSSASHCPVLLEFGLLAGSGAVSEAFLKEHGEVLAADLALVQMAEKIKNLN